MEVVFHDRIPIYRNPSVNVKTQSGWYSSLDSCSGGRCRVDRRRWGAVEINSPQGLILYATVSVGRLRYTRSHLRVLCLAG